MNCQKKELYYFHQFFTWFKSKIKIHFSESAVVSAWKFSFDKKFYCSSCQLFTANACDMGEKTHRLLHSTGCGTVFAFKIVWIVESLQILFADADGIVYIW